MIDVAALRAEIEAEREWRDREMRILRNQVAALPDEDSRGLARKALVVMLYAHFEGLVKAIFAMYVSRLNALSLKVAEVVPALAAASLSDMFRALRDPNAKCKEFARDLPDDTALHRFARDREFIEVASAFAARVVEIDGDIVVDTESNLKPVVLRKILFRLGFEPGVVQPWEGGIHQLLRRRNDVAHGTAKAGLSEQDYRSLEHAVEHVVDEIVRFVTGAVATEAYRASTA
jgi:hypothetical protein